jgi:hypothetical protein
MYWRTSHQGTVQVHYRVQCCLPRKDIECRKYRVIAHIALIINASTGKGMVTVAVQYLIITTCLNATRLVLAGQEDVQLEQHKTRAAPRPVHDQSWVMQEAIGMPRQDEVDSAKVAPIGGWNLRSHFV